MFVNGFGEFSIWVWEILYWVKTHLIISVIDDGKITEIEKHATKHGIISTISMALLSMIL